jgi:acetoin utilization deacetylase AcuC-like enzyme
MLVFYTPRYYADIGETHIFPIRKFQLVRDKLIAEGTLHPGELEEPAPADVADVLLVHTEDYVTRLRNGTLTDKEIRRLGLPWSESLVRRSFYAVGGTIAAALHSLATGYSSNLAGGTHHSFPERGEGFCVLNDVAIAIRILRSRGLIQRAAIVDCDVHQGNGTATILKVTRTLSPSQCTEQTTIRSSKPDRVWTLSYPMEQRMKNTWVYSRRTCLLSSNINLKSFSTLPVRIHSPETN